MSQMLKFRCVLVAMLLTSFDASVADVARGYVFHDTNGNGIFDRNESGVRGVAVSNGREVVATDTRGQYALPVRITSFRSLKVRRYRIERCVEMIVHFFEGKKWKAIKIPAPTAATNKPIPVSTGVKYNPTRVNPSPANALTIPPICCGDKGCGNQ